MTIIKIISFIDLLIYFSIRLYFYHKNNLIVSGHYGAREGKFMFAIRNGVAFLGFIFYFMFLFDVKFVQFSFVEIPFFLNMLGAVLVFLGLAFLFIVHLGLGKNFTPTLDIKKEHKLVTTGVYAYVRHPMYTALLLLVYSSALLLGNYIIFFFAIFATIYIKCRIPDEEKLMIDSFGEDYKKYIQNSGCLTPKFFK